MDGAFGRRGFGPTSMMTICCETCTCGAARPAPSYSYMVSIMSSINCWRAGVRDLIRRHRFCHLAQHRMPQTGNFEYHRHHTPSCWSLSGPQLRGILLHEAGEYATRLAPRRIYSLSPLSSSGLRTIDPPHNFPINEININSTATGIAVPIAIFPQRQATNPGNTSGRNASHPLPYIPAHPTQNGGLQHSSPLSGSRSARFHGRCGSSLWKR